MKFKYLIVDDEPLARKLIASHAAKIDVLECVGECGNAFEASNMLRNKHVDLVFLDIQMPEVSGIQLANALKNPPAIILTTAFRDFAPEAFDLEVVDYLLKPISFERFLKAANKFFDGYADKRKTVLVNPSQEDLFVFLKAERKIHKLAASDILYIESLDDYVKVYEKEKTHLTRENISGLAGKLPTPPFVRIHRSFIVNATWVKTVSNESVWINGKELPFGRVFKKSAFRLLSEGLI
jgi:DNA-binding LytR/AlgR family response regulator